MCRSSTAGRPSASEVAERLKSFNEGKVPVRQFFSDNVSYRDPLLYISNADTVSLLFTIMWCLLEHVSYDVKSTYQGPGSSVMVEAEVTYSWIRPLSWLLKAKKQHFYHTLNITCSSGSSWRCNHLETIRDSYTLSLPSRILTGPPLFAINVVLRLRAFVVSGLRYLFAAISKKALAKLMKQK
eukprot:TRINITY_DN769_c0_g2_i2.p1 TRINITY_DN769_c0_g2~~TRINITY_DN769_c0_g2_i2.p1  ORF type:complete len:191 (+),score=11.35 TRINITY_DN769_c0_g2_i2:25-573(+)